MDPRRLYHVEIKLGFMLTTVEGKFKINAIHNVIHEMVHLGIEDNIVKKFKLEHWEKEALVDSICILKFGSLLTNYRYQNNGNTKIREYINVETVENVPKIIKKYVSDYQDNLCLKYPFYNTGLPYSVKRRW
jgi:hypothetical protein